MAKREMVADDLDYLREESRQTVLFCVIGVVYIWLIAVLDSSLLDSTRYLLGVLWELVIVISGVLVAFMARNRGQSLASASIIACVAAAIVHNMWLVGMGVALLDRTRLVSLS